MCVARLFLCKTSGCEEIVETTTSLCPKVRAGKRCSMGCKVKGGDDNWRHETKYCDECRERQTAKPLNEDEREQTEE